MAGLANEHVWDLRLKATLPDTHILLSEEELGLKLTLPNGLPFSGRPDHAYCRKGVDGALLLLSMCWNTREYIAFGLHVM
jgi:hypothetical protein